MERLLISKEGLRYDIIYNLINYIGSISNIGGSLCTDKQSKEEIDKKLEQYITEKTDKES